MTSKVGGLSLCEHFSYLKCNLRPTYELLFCAASMSTGKRKEFVLPDRNQCLSMDQPFLKSYRDLLIQTCHTRGANATDGMAAHLLPMDEEGHVYQETLAKVKR